MLYKTIFILFCIYFAGIEGQDREGWPEYKSCPEMKGWLKIHLEPADYDTARAKCKEEGAQLLNPYIPEFEENAVKLLNASSTAEKPILAVYSLAKVDHVYAEGFEKRHGRFSSFFIAFFINEVVFICLANPQVHRFLSQLSLYGSKVSDEPDDLDSPYVFELDHFDPNKQSKKN